MLRFLLGIVVIQAATLVLVLLAPDNLQGIGWLRLIIPLILMGVFSAFWFNSIAKHLSKDQLASVKEEHAREREKIQLNAERAKTRLVKKTQQQIAKESKIAHGKANFKVGAALAGVMGLGALMLLTQFLTLGVITLTTAGGALGGYLYRGRKESQNRLIEPGQIDDIKLIKQEGKKAEEKKEKGVINVSAVSKIKKIGKPGNR